MGRLKQMRPFVLILRVPSYVIPPKVYHTPGAGTESQALIVMIRGTLGFLLELTVMPQEQKPEHAGEARLFALKRQ